MSAAGNSFPLLGQNEEVNRQGSAESLDGYYSSPQLLGLLQYREGPWCHSDKGSVTLKRGGGRPRTRRTATRKRDRREAPDAIEHEHPESRSSAQPRIKPILPLNINLVQPQDQPNKNNAAESAKNEMLAGEVWNPLEISPNSQAHSRDGGAYIFIVGEKGNGNKRC